MSATKYPIALFLAAMSGLFAVPANAQDIPSAPAAPPPEGPPQDSGWRIDVGGGVLTYPRFPGAKDTRVLPIPAIEVHYGDRFFASVREGVGYNLVRSGGFEAGPVVNFVFPREESNARQALRGLGDVPFTVEAGGFVRYNFGQIASATVGARKGVNGHEGVVVDGEISLNAPPLLDNRLFLSIGPKLSFYDKDYARAYYGVTPQQSARSGYAVFAPGSGYQASVNAGAAYLLTPRLTLSTFAGYGRLFGDIDRSPIVRGRFGSRDQFTGGANLTYRFNLGG